MKDKTRAMLNKALKEAYSRISQFPIDKDTKRSLQNHKYRFLPGWADLISDQVEFINNAYLAGTVSRDRDRQLAMSKTIREALYSGGGAKENTPPALVQMVMAAYKAGKEGK